MKRDKIFSIFNISSEEEFNRFALEVFRYQYDCNPVYKQYSDIVCKDIEQIINYRQIPFLPVEFYKTQKIISGNNPVSIVFGSSGTTGQQRSFHYVTDLEIYEKSAIASFESNYGDIADYIILALLPSYLERKDSSLVWMCNLFINKSNYKQDSGFYLNNYAELLLKLKKLVNEKDRKVLLLGVSYALLDIAEMIDFPVSNVIVMETGGMKGMRKEMLREELHEILCNKLGISTVHSEYGMTELLSQAYSQGNGIFKCPPWMKVLTRELNDPLALAAVGKTGGINIIDLANLNSCSFIATQDVGKCHNDGTFGISGRSDNSDIRGCNLLVGGS
jgi:hypothetical protein